MTIDWTQQWAMFAPGFRDGKAHIDLTLFGGKGELLLLPGQGFGDLSHPTTHLVLDLMGSHIQGAEILDVGTGSGILLLAALLLGAKKGVGIDIDKEALLHAQANSKLNRLSSRAKFSLLAPKKLPLSICFMNMILSEQIQVKPHLLNDKASLWITSGILQEQHERYLEQAHKWGWELLLFSEKEGWMGYVFKKSHSNLSHPFIDF